MQHKLHLNCQSSEQVKGKRNVRNITNNLTHAPLFYCLQFRLSNVIPAQADSQTNTLWVFWCRSNDSVKALKE